MSEILRTPEERFAALPGYPFAPHWLDEVAGFPGARVHYVDERPAGPARPETVVCLHGHPTWSYLFRRMIPVFVAAGYRTVALDLPGFGKSDKPADESLFTVESLRGAVVDAVGRLALDEIVAVGHDWGGTLALSLPQALPERVSRHFPAVDILVNNAGIGSNASPHRIVDYDDDFWDLSIAVNLSAPYLLTKALVPEMVERGWGRVINMASVVGKRGLVAAGAYTATKHGLIGLTRTAALETAGTGVTINAICPGATRTVMLLRRLKVDAELRGESVADVEASINPIGRLLEPDEIAELAVYLASDDARGMTGQALNLSGGSTMH